MIIRNGGKYLCDICKIETCLDPNLSSDEKIVLFCIKCKFKKEYGTHNLEDLLKLIIKYCKKICHPCSRDITHDTSCGWNQCNALLFRQLLGCYSKIWPDLYLRVINESIKRA